VEEKSKVILIADVDDENVELLSSVFIKEGYMVDRAKRVSQVLEKIQTSQVDVLILDVEMPGMKGYEIIPVIKRINNKIPIIMTSIDNSLELAKRVREAGVFFYIIKPLDIEEIKLVVRDAFRKIGKRNKGTHNLYGRINAYS